MSWIILGILVLIVIFLVGMYNNLVRLKVTCDNAWADIDVQLKRRYDLIPNLVETVKGYAGHEKGTLEAVINARNRAMTATSPADKAQAENMLSGALKSLFALSEAYPQLRAIESFTSLQNSLSQIEDTVQNARRYYNAVVRPEDESRQPDRSGHVSRRCRCFSPSFFFRDQHARTAHRKLPVTDDRDAGRNDRRHGNDSGAFYWRAVARTVSDDSGGIRDATRAELHVACGHQKNNGRQRAVAQI